MHPPYKVSRVMFGLAWRLRGSLFLLWKEIFWNLEKVEQEGKTETAIIPDRWLNGQMVSFQNWAPGLPKYTGNKWEGDCVGMYGLGLGFETLLLQKKLLDWTKPI